MKRERESQIFKGTIKIYYIGLQLCYSVILHLGWHYSTIAKKFAILRLSKSSCWAFRCLVAKFLQHFPFTIPNGDALRASVSGFAYAIICYILALKHNNSPLLGLVIVKKFAIVLLYYPKLMMVL